MLTITIISGIFLIIATILGVVLTKEYSVVKKNMSSIIVLYIVPSAVFIGFLLIVYRTYFEEGEIKDLRQYLFSIVLFCINFTLSIGAIILHANSKGKN